MTRCLDDVANDVVSDVVNNVVKRTRLQISKDKHENSRH